MPQYNCPPLSTLVSEIAVCLRNRLPDADVDCSAEMCPNVSNPPYNLGGSQLGQLVHIVPDSMPTADACRTILAGRLLTTIDGFHVVSDQKASQVLRISAEADFLALCAALCDFFESKLGKNWEMLCIESPNNGKSSACVRLLRSCKSEGAKTIASGEKEPRVSKPSRINIFLAPISRRIVSGTTRQSHSPCSAAAFSSSNGVQASTDDKTKKKKVLKRVVKQPPSLSSVSLTSTLSSEAVSMAATPINGAVHKENGGIAVNGNESTAKLNGTANGKPNGVASQTSMQTANSTLVSKMTAMFSGRRNSRDATPTAATAVTIASTAAAAVTIASNSVVSAVKTTNSANTTIATTSTTVTTPAVTVTTTESGNSVENLQQIVNCKQQLQQNAHLADNGFFAPSTSASEMSRDSSILEAVETLSAVDSEPLSTKPDNVAKAESLNGNSETSTALILNEIHNSIPQNNNDNGKENDDKEMNKTVVSNGIKTHCNGEIAVNGSRHDDHVTTRPSLYELSPDKEEQSITTITVLPKRETNATDNSTIAATFNLSSQSAEIMRSYASRNGSNEDSSRNSTQSSRKTAPTRASRSTRSLPPIPATTATRTLRLGSIGVLGAQRRRILSTISSGSGTSSSLTEEDEDLMRTDEDEDETLLLSSATAPNDGSSSVHQRWTARLRAAGVLEDEEDDSEALGDLSLRDDLSYATNTPAVFARTFIRPNSSTDSALSLSASTSTLKAGSSSSPLSVEPSAFPVIKSDNIATANTSEMVRVMSNQMPVVVLQQVLANFSYHELCGLRRVHPHWDELCGQMLNSAYYQLIHVADRLLIDCQRRVHLEKFLAKPIQVITNLQVHVINPVDVLRAAIDEGVVCFPYGLLLDKAFELVDRIEFIIQQRDEVSDAFLNWERLAEFARRAQVHYRKIMEPEAERRMAEVYKLSAVQRLQRIDSFLAEASVNKLEKDSEKAKDDMRWELEQLKTQNQQLKKDNRELKQTCLKLDGRIDALERKFKTIARFLQ